MNYTNQRSSENNRTILQKYTVSMKSGKNDMPTTGDYLNELITIHRMD